MRNQSLRASQPRLYSHKTYCVTENKIHNILWSAIECAVFMVFIVTCIALISLSDSLDQYILGGF